MVSALERRDNDNNPPVSYAWPWALEFSWKSTDPMNLDTMMESSRMDWITVSSLIGKEI